MESRAAIEKVKSLQDIVSVVEKYVKLKKTGKNYSGLCPFHNEKTPSFNVSPDIQIYKCFGCGKSGDIFSFIQEVEKIDFPQALDKLAQEVGVDIKKKVSKFDYLYKVNDLAQKYFVHSLEKSDPAKDYLIEQRKIPKAFIDKFEIGYAPKRSDLSELLLRRQKVPYRDQIKVGLSVSKNSSTRSKFNDRIIFPIHNSYGKIVGFSGRQMPKNEFGPKYLNTPETPIFKKRDLLYGFYQAKASLRKDDLCIIVEGQTDVIAAHMAGYTNTVAPLGTGLTSSQLKMISRYTNNILFMFDNDNAGYQALQRGFELSSELGLNSYTAQLPDPYKDIDELVKSSPALLEEVIKPNTDAFTFIISRYIEDLDIGKLFDQQKIIKFTTALLDKVPAGQTKNFYIKKFKEMTDFDIKNQGATNDHYQSQRTTVSHNNNHKKTWRPNSPSDQLILYCLKNDYMKFFETLDLKFFDKNRAELISILGNNKKFKIEELESSLTEKQFKYIQTLVMHFDNYPELEWIELEKTLAKLYLNVQNNFYSNKVAEFSKQERIAKAKGDDSKAEELALERMQLVIKQKNLV